MLLECEAVLAPLSSHAWFRPKATRGRVALLKLRKIEAEIISYSRADTLIAAAWPRAQSAVENSAFAPIQDDLARVA